MLGRPAAADCALRSSRRFRPTRLGSSLWRGWLLPRATQGCLGTDAAPLLRWCVHRALAWHQLQPLRFRLRPLCDAPQSRAAQGWSNGSIHAAAARQQVDRLASLRCVPPDISHLGCADCRVRFVQHIAELVPSRCGGCMAECARAAAWRFQHGRLFLVAWLRLPGLARWMLLSLLQPAPLPAHQRLLRHVGRMDSTAAWNGACRRSRSLFAAGDEQRLRALVAARPDLAHL
mmetsp:Transcript_40676/g.111906  ORF Transcript_40676/g.111906 Transcript_40676/m.111906 type:complete len:232 (+) Transcript_40676:181-876(+)